ncbi:MAG: ABC transporter substrate-binding protein [bacterium]|nr:ABC transporter substrate-binding protein [bacterium]MDE0438866.1 ABC transporter substrate-binding protein [bacterium]
MKDNRLSGRVGRKPLALLGALSLMIALFGAACSDDEETAATPAATEAAVTSTTQHTTTTAIPEPVTTTAAAAAITTTTLAPEPPGVTIRNCDVETVYDAVPQRVVATDTSALEVLMALGLQGHVIGYFGGTPDRLQPEHQARAALLERLGGSFPYPSLEAVLAPGPDLVFSYGFNESAGLTAQNLRDADVHSFSFTEACPDFAGNVTLEVMFNDVRAVAQMFEIEDRAEELIAAWEQQIEEVAAAIPAGEQVRVFYFDSGEEAPFTALGGSVMSDIISRAGGANILSAVNGTWGTVEWESVVEGDPELIILVDYGFGGPAANRAFLESNPALSDMPAVVNGHYVTLTFLQSVPGPQNLDGLIKVATAVRSVSAAR